jgi:hypothetical protein
MMRGGRVARRLAAWKDSPSGEGFVYYRKEEEAGGFNSLFLYEKDYNIR